MGGPLPATRKTEPATQVSPDPLVCACASTPPVMNSPDAARKFRIPACDGNDDGNGDCDGISDDDI
jgi:hypothetical protein